MTFFSFDVESKKCPKFSFGRFIVYKTLQSLFLLNSYINNNKVKNYECLKYMFIVSNDNCYQLPIKIFHTKFCHHLKVSFSRIISITF